MAHGSEVWYLTNISRTVGYLCSIVSFVSESQLSKWHIPDQRYLRYDHRYHTERR